jgi:flagellar protein FliO/FliZ
MLQIAATSVGTVPAAMPSLTSASSLGGLLLSLLLVIGVILLAAWLLRRLPGINASGNSLLKVRATLAVGMKERLLLVEAGGETLLIGVSASGVQCLHRFDAPLPEPTETGPNFAALLAQRLGARREAKP